MRHDADATAAADPQGIAGRVTMPFTEDCRDREPPCPELSASAKLSRGQLRALPVLLRAPSITEAARELDRNEKTLRRWLAQPAFRDAYHAYADRLFDHALGQLQAATGAAVQTLREALTEDNASVRVRSAQCLLSIAVQMRLDDVLARLERLEQREHEQ